jgi:hypothetical protein
MEGNSDITELVNDTQHIDCHPGTMNFKLRLLEARRIHERNMLLASRLDTIQPYYKVSDLTTKLVQPIKRKTQVKKKSKKSKFARELTMVLKGATDGAATHRSTGHDGATIGPLKFSKLSVEDPATQSQSARKADYGNQRSLEGGADPDNRGESPRNRPSNVLLEYTKIQDGRVLDVAVLKEPFRDRYAIFGIDVDDGQRYELRLTSDEVSSILDGDMLVTSVDNVEVWMALLNKVTLQRVEFFARLPFTSDEVDAYNNSHNNSTSGALSPGSRARAAQNNVRKEGDASDSEEFGEAVPFHYRLATGQKSASPPLSPTSNKRSAFADEPAERIPSAPAGSRPSADRPVSRITGSAGGTSAAGAVRNRHLRNGGAGHSGQVGAESTAAERLAAADPILSLFADAGIDVEEARTELVTPGFLANATSAPVQLVETNDDFPEPPAPVVLDQVYQADSAHSVVAGNVLSLLDASRHPRSRL